MARELPVTILVRSGSAITVVIRTTTGSFCEPPSILLADAAMTVTLHLVV